MRSVVVAAIAVIAFLPAVAAAAIDIAPGKWASSGTVTDVEMPGLPPEAVAMMKRRPISHSFCLTAEQAAKDPRKLFTETSGKCNYRKFDMSGGKLSAVMQCLGPQGDMQMTMTGTYTASSYATTNVMVMAGPGGRMRMTSKVTGKRTGDC
jgi:hypothetical protein